MESAQFPQMTLNVNTKGIDIVGICRDSKSNASDGRINFIYYGNTRTECGATGKDLKGVFEM